MRDTICFISVGQGGGNIGELLAQEGYKVLAINTSEEDLSTLKNVGAKYHIKEGTGCSKNRTTAKYLFTNDMENIISKIKSFTDGFEFVYLIFSAGGGTGSGISPVLSEVLMQDVFVEEDEHGKYTNKYLGIVTILASEDDSPQARENTITCMNEIMSVDGLSGVWCIKNTSKRSLQSTNRTFVNILTNVLDIPERDKSSDGNVDKSEIIRTLSAGGTIVATSVSGKKINTMQIVESLNNGIFADLDRSTDSKGMAYCLSSTQAMLNYSIITNEFGFYRDEFHTFNQDRNIIVLSGLAYPVELLENYNEKLKVDAKRLSEQSKVRRKQVTIGDGSVLDSIEVSNNRNADETSVEKVLSRREELLERFRSHNRHRI